MDMRLILVDDEKGIVDGLKKMISRYIPECEVVGTAHNGADGIKLVQKIKPDIVITDIRMPQTDGLDMIHMVQEAGVHTKFILLSGYADFEYARRGMQLGVQFYINKPVEEEELRDCLYSVMKAIQEERVKRREVDDLRQEVHSLMQENALRDLLDIGSENEEVIEELLQIARIPSAGTWFGCMLLEFYGSADTLKDSVIQQVLLQIDQILGKYRGVYRFRYSSTQIAVIVSQSRSIGYADLVSSVHRLKEQVYQHYELSMTVGIGTVQKGAAGISLSFEQARHALSYKVIKGANAVIAFPELDHLTGRSEPVPEEMITKLEAALENLDEKEGISLIRDIFRTMEARAGISPADLQLQCLNILLSSVRKMSFQQLQQNDFLGRHILSLEEMSRFRTLESLKEWMAEVIRKIIVFKQEHNIPKKKDIIAEVKEYVAEHYSEPITLADLSARFFISPYYLSQYFKQKTGDTYVNFLTQIRINKAKELLERTDLKVYEICQMVGYSDTQHFARMFEKLMGYKPRDYRKQLPKT